MARFVLALVALGMTVGARAPVHAAEAPIPIEALATPSTASVVRLSPDGSRIAAYRTGPGADFVYILDVADPGKVVRRINVGYFQLSDLVWAGNDRLVMHHVFNVQVLGINIGTAQLKVVDVATGATRQIDGGETNFRATDVLYVDPKGASALVAGLGKFDKSPSVMRVDLGSGAFTKVQDSVRDVWHWFVDGDGVVRGGLAHENLKWALHYRTAAGAPLNKVVGKFDRKDVDIIEGVYFSPLGGETMVVSNHVNGRFAAYRLDLATVEPGAMVFENPNGDIGRLLTDSGTNRIVGARYHDRRWRTRWSDPELAKVQARIDKAAPDADNALVDWSRDRNRILIHSTKPDDPGTYYVLDRAKGEMKIVLVPYGKLVGQPLSPVTSIDYTARDGLNIPAFLTIPKGSAGKAMPMILFPHGGPFSADTWDYDPWVQFFASRGYVVLQPQFRGTTGFGRQGVERGFGEFGGKMIDDMEDGIDHLVKAGIVDPKRVCIAGGSYGGYAAMWAPARSPERYRCAISWAGISNVRDQLKFDRGLFGAKRYYRDWRDRVLGIDEKRGDMAAISPVRRAANFRVPLLIGHGKRDDTVPVDQSQQMEAALKKAGASVEAIYYDKQGHSVDLSDDYADWLWRMEKFLAAHNPTDRLVPASVSAFPSRKEAAKGAPSKTE